MRQSNLDCISFLSPSDRSQLTRMLIGFQRPVTITKRNHTFSGFSMRNRVSPLRNAISRNKLYGLTSVLVGSSQLPLAFLLADLTNQSLAVFVIGSGGWLLIGLGINLLQGKRAFHTEWTDNERYRWLIAAVICLLAFVVVIATGLILLSR